MTLPVQFALEAPKLSRGTLCEIRVQTQQGHLMCCGLSATEVTFANSSNPVIYYTQKHLLLNKFKKIIYFLML